MVFSERPRGGGHGVQIMILMGLTALGLGKLSCDNCSVSGCGGGSVTFDVGFTDFDDDDSSEEPPFDFAAIHGMLMPREDDLGDPVLGDTDDDHVAMALGDFEVRIIVGEDGDVRVLEEGDDVLLEVSEGVELMIYDVEGWED